MSALVSSPIKTESRDFSSHQASLDKAKIRLMSSPDSVFITTVCLSMRHVWSYEVPTAAVDGNTIWFNPDFWIALDKDEQFFLLQHETWHPCFMHMVRRGTRDPRKYNIAGDHVINLMLLARGGKMPKGGLADPQYTGMDTDQIYDLLPDDPQMDCPHIGDIKEASGSTMEESEKALEDLLIRAAIQSKSSSDKPGTIPGIIQIFLDSLLNPKLPWHRILHKYFQARNKSDYTYRKFNRRFFPKYYLPTLDGEALMEVTIAVDASGSVSTADFSQFVAEIADIMRRFKPSKITIITFDYGIRSVDVVTDVQSLMNVKFTGRGGTAIEPVLDWVKDNKPTVLLVFTDGEFRFHKPDPPKKTDVVWLIHGGHKFQAPFGKTIAYEI